MLIVFYWSMDSHARRIREVLHLFQNSGVALNPSKFYFFQKAVECLLQIVRPGQLPVNQKNINSLELALPPRIQKKLKSLPGMCNLYRRFVKDDAHIAKPLNKLSSNELPHVLPALDASQLAAFKYLEERPAPTPTLALSRRESLFNLGTDACAAVHVECTLLQQQPDKEILPVGHHIRGLTPAEQNYSRTDCECLSED